MPVPRINVITNTITKVLVREVGWVSIEPGSFRYLYLNYTMQVSELELPQTVGYEYPAFECKYADSGDTFYIQSDNIIGIEVAPAEQEGS